MRTTESGVDQLIQRVKAEGLEKASAERNEILKRAHNEAAAIVEKATMSAQALFIETQNAISHERRKFETELNLAARDFSARLHDRLKAQMFFPAIKENVRATLKEPEFLKEVLIRLITDYIKTNPANIDVLVPKELKTTLAAYFASSIFDSLERENSSINFIDGDDLEGFKLMKLGTNYSWDFSVDTIAAELTRLIEPSLRKYFSTKVATNTAVLEPTEEMRA